MMNIQGAAADVLAAGVSHCSDLRALVSLWFAP